MNLMKLLYFPEWPFVRSVVISNIIVIIIHGLWTLKLTLFVMKITNAAELSFFCDFPSFFVTYYPLLKDHFLWKYGENNHEMSLVVVIHFVNNNNDNDKTLEQFSIRIYNGHLWLIITPSLDPVHWWIFIIVKSSFIFRCWCQDC